MMLVNLAMFAEDESVQRAAATEILHMTEGKPVGREITLTSQLDNINEDQLDAMLRGELGRLSEEERGKLLGEKGVIGETDTSEGGTKEVPNQAIPTPQGAVEVSPESKED